MSQLRCACRVVVVVVVVAVLVVLLVVVVVGGGARGPQAWRLRLRVGHREARLAAPRFYGRAGC